MRAGFRRAARRPERRDRAGRQHPRARHPPALGARPARAPAAREHRRRVPHAAPPARAAERGGARGRPPARAAGGHARRAPGRRRRRAHQRRAGVRRALRDRRTSSPGSAISRRACAGAGPSWWSTPTTRSAASRSPSHELGLGAAWVVGGGYKYLQLGEGNCFLRLPAHAGDLRPVGHGWYAEFGALADEHDPSRVAYGRGAERFAGSTYDPTSHYRAARVFAFFEEQGLTPERLRASYRRQVDLLAAGFDALGAPDAVITRDRGVAARALRRLPRAALAARRRAPAGARRARRAHRQPRGVAAARAGAIPVRRAARGGHRAPRRCDRRRRRSRLARGRAGEHEPMAKSKQTTISSTICAPAACARRSPRPSRTPPSGRRGASAPRRSRRPRSPTCVRRATRSGTASSTASGQEAQRGREEGRAHAQAQGGPAQGRRQEGRGDSALAPRARCA